MINACCDFRAHVVCDYLAPLECWRHNCNATHPQFTHTLTEDVNTLTPSPSPHPIHVQVLPPHLPHRPQRSSLWLSLYLSASSRAAARVIAAHLHSGCYQLFLKGASEILTTKCTRHVVVSKNLDHGQNVDSEIKTKAIDEITKDNISRTIIFYTNLC